MGLRDAEEMLEAAKADVVRLAQPELTAVERVMVLVDRLVAAALGRIQEAS